MTTAKPRLLFVSHHFPPDTSIGSKRSHRIAAQMAARGWQVDVLCAHELYQDGRDLSLMAGLGDVNIVRTHELNPRAWARWLRDRARGGDGTHMEPTARPRRDDDPRPAQSGAARHLRALLHEARGAISAGMVDWVEFPDQWGGWLPAALAAAERLPRPDVVLATVPISTSVLVATALATRFDAALVLDYRDPWNAALRRDHLPPARRLIERRLEAACHLRAAALVTVTPGLADEIGGQAGRHVHVIPNASEPERLAGIAPRAFARPTLVYAGGLYGGRSVTPLLASLARLRASGVLADAPLGLMVMGSDNQHVLRDAESLGVADLVEVLPRQTHAVAMAAALGAAANLLVVAPAHKLQVPAKVFEHIAAGRPILALSPAGADVDAVLSDHPSARCVRPEDERTIDAALRDLALGEWRGSAEIPAPYTVGATMDKLDALLRRVTNRRRPRQRRPAIKLAATGDLMLPPAVCEVLCRDAKATLGSAGEALRDADIGFGNLETPVVYDASPVAGSNPLQPVFVASERAAAHLREAGYRVLNLANNHIADAGPDGIIQTLEACRAAGIATVGAGRNIAEARRPAVIDVDGVTVGVLGYSSFCTATPSSPGSAPMHPAAMANDVARLRREVDHVVVSLHAGIEYAELPTTGFRKTCHALIDAGADLVLGHHPHVYQGHERVGAGLVVYSLGNTLADTIDPETKRLAFERTQLVLSGVRELTPDEPRLEDVVVVTSLLSDAPVAVELTLHRLRGDLCVHPASAEEADRFALELADQQRALATDDPRMAAFERLDLQSSVGAVMNARSILGRLDRIRPHHVKLGARWLASQLRGS